MKSSDLRFGLFVCVGLLLLLLPMEVFHGDFAAPAARKLTVLRYLTVSITGLVLLALALLIQSFRRRSRRLEDKQA